MEENTSVGQRVRQYRKALNLTQKQLAERINSTQQLITKIESDEIKQSRSFFDLAKVFGVSVESLVDGESARPESAINNSDIEAALRIAVEDTFTKAVKFGWITLNDDLSAKMFADLVLDKLNSQ